MLKKNTSQHEQPRLSCVIHLERSARSIIWLYPDKYCVKSFKFAERFPVFIVSDKLPSPNQRRAPQLFLTRSFRLDRSIYTNRAALVKLNLFVCLFFYSLHNTEILNPVIMLDVIQLSSQSDTPTFHLPTRVIIVCIITFRMLFSMAMLLRVTCYFVFESRPILIVSHLIPTPNAYYKPTLFTRFYTIETNFHSGVLLESIEIC